MAEKRTISTKYLNNLNNLNTAGNVCLASDYLLSENGTGEQKTILCQHTAHLILPNGCQGSFLILTLK